MGEDEIIRLMELKPSVWTRVLLPINRDGYINTYLCVYVGFGIHTQISSHGQLKVAKSEDSK